MADDIKPDNSAPATEVTGSEHPDRSEDLVHTIIPAKAPPMWARAADANKTELADRKGDDAKDDPKPATDEEKVKYEVDEKGFVKKNDKGEPIAKVVEPVKPATETVKPEDEPPEYNPEAEALREELKVYEPFREELDYREIAMAVSPTAYFIDLIQSWGEVYPELKNIKGFFGEVEIEGKKSLKEIVVDIDDYVKNVKVGLKELALKKQTEEQAKVKEADEAKSQQAQWQKDISSGIETYMTDELGKNYNDEIYKESALAVAKYIRTGENWKKDIPDIVKIVCHDIAKKYRNKPEPVQAKPEAAKPPVKPVQPSSFGDKGGQAKPKPATRQESMWAVAAKLNTQTLRGR
jgi:hypothetical protein